MPNVVTESLSTLITIVALAMIGVVPSKFDPPPPLLSNQRWGYRGMLIVLGVITAMELTPAHWARHVPYGALLVACLYISTVWAVVRSRHHRPWRALGLDPATALFEGLWALRIALGAASALAIVAVLLTSVRLSRVADATPPGRWFPEGQFALFLSGFLVVMVLGPIAEELVFRGIVYTPLFAKFGVSGAALGSAALWAVSHYDGPSYASLAKMAFIVILGIVYAEVYRRRASLVPTIMFHVVGNTTITFLLSRHRGTAVVVLVVAVTLWIVSVVWFGALNRARCGTRDDLHALRRT